MTTTDSGYGTGVTALSLGAGVQSTAIALLSVEGILPRPDVAIFADTGWEPRNVYEHLDRLAVVLADAGIPLRKVSNGNLRNDAIDPDHRYASIPYFVRNPDGTDGMGRRQCTSEYKLSPIMREVRKMLGAAAPDYKRVPKGRVCEQWIGFSTDEIGRVGGKYPSYTRAWYPLLDLGWTRTDCVSYLRSVGWGSTTKSACIGCPYHGNRQWRDLRDTDPEGWQDAVEFDEAIRKGGSRGLPLNGEALLHRQRVPLPLVDLRTPSERHADAGQTALFDMQEEVGDPDGCGPFSCRSGQPVTLGEDAA